MFISKDELEKLQLDVKELRKEVFVSKDEDDSDDGEDSLLDYYNRMFLSQWQSETLLEKVNRVDETLEALMAHLKLKKSKTPTMNSKIIIEKVSKKNK